MTERLDEVLLDIHTDPARGDYTAARRLWTSSPHYQPYGRDSEEVEEFHMRVSAGRFEEAIALGKQLLEAEPIRVTLHLLMARALDAHGDDWEAGDHRAMAHGYCKALLRTGDGRGPETALSPVEPWEIPLALDLLGLRAVRSEQQQAAGRWFDRVEAVDREGESREVWFDVTVMQAWLRDAG